MWSRSWRQNGHITSRKGFDEQTCFLANPLSNTMFARQSFLDALQLPRPA